MKIDDLTLEQLREVARHHESLISENHRLKEDKRRAVLLLKESHMELQAVSARLERAEKTIDAHGKYDVVLYISAVPGHDSGVEVVTAWRQQPVWNKPCNPAQALAMDLLNSMGAFPGAQFTNVNSDVPTPFTKPRIVPQPPTEPEPPRGA